ncbi:MAG: WG repeat-containing protein, partial [Bacteroidales bacterium]
NKNGNTVIPFIYEDGHKVFSNGLAGMRLNGAWGFINPKGETVIPFLYDTVTLFSNGRAQAVYHGLIHSIDTQGRTLE